MSPALNFLLFAAVTFVVLRLVIDRLTRAKKPIWAGPLFAIFGAASGVYFFRLGMHSFFIWHLILFGLVILSWHVKSRADEKNIAKATATHRARLDRQLEHGEHESSDNLNDHAVRILDVKSELHVLLRRQPV